MDKKNRAKWTLENIKDPEQVEIAAKTENVEKFVERSKQVKN